MSVRTPAKTPRRGAVQAEDGGDEDEDMAPVKTPSKTPAAGKTPRRTPSKLR
jgi:hypothetical protein